MEEIIMTMRKTALLMFIALLVAFFTAPAGASCVEGDCYNVNSDGYITVVSDVQNMNHDTTPNCPNGACTNLHNFQTLSVVGASTSNFQGTISLENAQYGNWEETSTGENNYSNKHYGEIYQWSAAQGGVNPNCPELKIDISQIFDGKINTEQEVNPDSGLRFMTGAIELKASSLTGIKSIPGSGIGTSQQGTFGYYHEYNSNSADPNYPKSWQGGKVIISTSSGNLKPQD